MKRSSDMDYLAVLLVLLISLTLINTALHHSRFKRSKGKMYWKTSRYLDRIKRFSSPFSPFITDNPGKTYMENVTQYPEKKLRELLNKEGEKYKDFFGNEIIPPMNGRRIFPGDHSEIQLCPSATQIIFPKVAVNKDGQWKYVVNLGDDYIQGVRVETCRHMHSCTFNDAFPPGYKTSCEQRFVYKRLLSVTDNGNTIVDEFKMPSCCKCIIKKIQLF